MLPNTSGFDWSLLVDIDASVAMHLLASGMTDLLEPNDSLFFFDDTEIADTIIPPTLPGESDSVVDTDNEHLAIARAEASLVMPSGHGRDPQDALESLNPAADAQVPLRSLLDLRGVAAQDFRHFTYDYSGEYENSRTTASNFGVQPPLVLDNNLIQVPLGSGNNPGLPALPQVPGRTGPHRQGRRGGKGRAPFSRKSKSSCFASLHG